MFPPFADDSIALKESWNGTARCVNFENVISRNVEKSRQKSGLEEGIDERKGNYFFLARFVDAPLILL
jgi:hypothetical protein